MVDKSWIRKTSGWQMFKVKTSSGWPILRMSSRVLSCMDSLRDWMKNVFHHYYSCSVSVFPIVRSRKIANAQFERCFGAHNAESNLKKLCWGTGDKIEECHKWCQKQEFGFSMFGKVQRPLPTTDSIWNIFGSSLAVPKPCKTLRNVTKLQKNGTHYLFMRFYDYLQNVIGLGYCFEFTGNQVVMKPAH